MAITASFHRNVTLLNQLVPPDHDFKKIFRQGMFDKPNTTGFIYVSHYLLTIYDAERFKKVVEWPVICKKTETKYRNSVKDYLNVIALENPDIGFPRVVTTYLHHASGTKFITIMWKLSQLALKMYIMRDGEYKVIFTPKPSLANDLVKTYLQQSKANINCDILSRHRNYVQMEKAANFALAQEKEYLTKIKTELFDKKQSLAKCASSAPVTESIKQCLTNVEDTDIVSMWKNSLNKNIQYIQKRYMILSDLEKTCEKTSGIISNLLNDSKALDSKQLEKINCSLISELPFPPDVQHCLYHLYNDNRLIYHNFIRLLTLILYQIYQCLRKDDLVDLSQCLLQVEASTEDMKSMCNVFETFLANMTSSTEEMQNDLCVKSTERISEDKNVLPFVKNILLMSSPLIKINTNCANQRNELQFTPTEIAHKSLFSRYIRHSKNCTPDIKRNLYVSRISIDSHTMLNGNEKQELRFVTPKVNQLCKRTTGKYSRLFATYKKQNIKVNSSMMSLQSTTQSNSAIASIEEISSSSDFNLDTITKGFINWSEEPSKVSYSSIQFTPIKRNVSKVASQQQVKNKLDHKIKVNKPELDEFTEVQIVNDDDKSTIIKHENDSKRRSISDLVERYKKILEVSNSVTAKLENTYVEYEIE
ncbi:hypothetical protein ALC56_08149 [Trachymyrmex septentrionalis]|uniref:HAUS augmin-like complex subunit 6 N-terminal domain-containing protein n=1 Tax=Trachymyrmex septentrionalis TaxID=34720 RepID=A0A151JVG5_9HYME|nr:PREDICTED: uncharacterized protein LOC108750169 [Trachymyrmex septentrionalis]KYN37492.1 hypothetical protein ALC56_08149 [Trachymyrmex septentrionalis]